jgi:hypothetical protein
VRSTQGAQHRVRGARRIYLHRLGQALTTERAGYTPSLVQHCSVALSASLSRRTRWSAAWICQVCAAHCCAAYSLSIGATASRGAASVTCVDCCSASARPIVPPLVWLQPFCLPSSLLLCGCLSAFRGDRATLFTCFVRGLTILRSTLLHQFLCASTPPPYTPLQVHPILTSLRPSAGQCSYK